MRKRLLSVWCLFFFLPVLIATSNPLFAETSADEINKAIAEAGANWTAGENWVTKLPPEDRRRLCGTFLEAPDPATTNLLQLPVIENLPPEFDWRDNNGDWVTPVKDQGNCGSCWAFSVLAQVESWWKIDAGNPGTRIDLSEQFLLSCSDGTCNGWGLDNALNFVKVTGVPSEACFPYQANDQIPCSAACNDWRNQATKIQGWGFITLEEAIVENIKSAVFRHPVSAAFIVYEDFHSYSGGVYEHVVGDVDGGHGILIVGWNDDEQSWICKNSWGASWGENGYFRIKWGQCEMGKNIPFVWNEVINRPALSIQPNLLKFSLTVGDSVTQAITLKNNSSQLLEFSSMDYGANLLFHQSSFNSWDGLSWWCGDPRIRGYDDHWLQYLDTPEIDLSQTTAPALNWMGFWSIEGTEGAERPWDGWDGCNVWVSVDGGGTFQVVRPISPQYNCQSMWSFGNPEQGWNMGTGIPGWGGTSGGWTPVLVDLSPFKSEQVVLRFAFASDLHLCTEEDPSLIGFFVDEIIVTDGSDTLFEEHGDGFHLMKRVSTGEVPDIDWLSISNRAGVIPPYDSTQAFLNVNTSRLILGDYNGLVKVVSNDVTQPEIEIPFSLQLQAPDYDLGVEEVWLPGESIPILFPVELGARVRNTGLQDATDFDVICTVTKPKQLLYSDSVRVPFMQSGHSELIKFKEFLATQTGTLNFNVTVRNYPNDYNVTNNHFHSNTNVSNLVDDFETETGFWDFQGGWAITDRFSGHSDQFAVNVNGGNTPYLPNMNARLTFRPGFHIHSAEQAILKFWTMYFTEPNKDICYVEVSTDSLVWQKVDSLSGNGLFWSQRSFNLKTVVPPDSPKVWVSFHFVSDNQTQRLCFLIDEVEIFTAQQGLTSLEPNQTGLHQHWALEQNYPNPFNMSTTIKYQVPQTGKVTLRIYNVNGQLVRTLLESNHGPGNYTVNWDGRDALGQLVGSGIYIYQLKAENKFAETKKLILLK